MEIIRTYFDNKSIETLELVKMRNLTSRLLKKNVISFEGTTWLIDLVSRKVNYELLNSVPKDTQSFCTEQEAPQKP